MGTNLFGSHCCNRGLSYNLRQIQELTNPGINIEIYPIFKLFLSPVLKTRTALVLKVYQTL